MSDTMNDTPIDNHAPAAYDPTHEATPMLILSTPSTPSLRTARPSFPAIRPGEGVKSLRTKPFRIGEVTIRPMGGDRWQLRYFDSASGRDVRRRLSGLTAKEIEAVALNIGREKLVHGGYIPGAKTSLPTVADGIAEAIALRVQTEGTRRDRARRTAQFVTWLGECHPDVKTWERLRPAHLQAYALAMRQRGCAWDSIRLALEPIRLGWRHMVENHPDLVRPLPRIKLVRPPQSEIEILDPVEVAGLLDWARANDPTVWPILALAGLAGLRLQEATALRRRDLDLDAGTITITKTDWHAPKNRASWRTIPLAGEALDALRHAVESQKVIPSGGEIFANAAGNLWRPDGLSARLGRSLDRAAEKVKMVRIGELPARKLRAFFATTASRLGASDRALKRYLGHSGGSILDGHYRQVSLAELRAVSGTMERWRQATALADFGNILATSGEHGPQALESVGDAR